MRRLTALIVLFLLVSFAAFPADPFSKALSLVIIDPGHGGHDPGAVANGINEKDLNLSIAIKLKTELQMKGFSVILTRDSDVFLSLQEREAVCKSADYPLDRSAIFISIHCNSANSKEASGFEVFTAHNEKIYDFLNEYSPLSSGYRFSTLNRKQASAFCHKASDLLSLNVVDSISENFPKLKNRGHKEGDLYVLNRSALPSVLVEVGFISNAEEAKLLETTQFQNKMAKAIALGVVRYSKSLSE